MKKNVGRFYLISGFLIIVTALIFVAYMMTLMGEEFVLLTYLNWIVLFTFPLLVAVTAGRQDIPFEALAYFSRMYETLAGYFIFGTSFINGFAICIWFCNMQSLTPKFAGFIFLALFIVLFMYFYFYFCVRLSYKLGERFSKNKGTMF